MNGLRPIALTSSVMKVLERLVLLPFQKIVIDFVDPLQFTYREGRSVDDAIWHVLDHAYSHLDKPATSIRLMFCDFSSTFFFYYPALSTSRETVNNKCAPNLNTLCPGLSEKPPAVYKTAV